ncbi:SGNH/GDSL hydrolase family protein, partial [Nonomuraea deserti]
MPQLTEPGNMPPPPYTKDGLVLAGSTLRQSVRVSAGGSRLRVRFSNAFGGAPLPITAASVALPEG